MAVERGDDEATKKEEDERSSQRVVSRRRTGVMNAPMHGDDLSKSKIFL
jgi:hypothetical protein